MSDRERERKKSNRRSESHGDKLLASVANRVHLRDKSFAFTTHDAGSFVSTYVPSTTEHPGV